MGTRVRASGAHSFCGAPNSTFMSNRSWGKQRGCKSKKRDRAVGEVLNRSGWGPGVGWGECSLRPREPGLDGTLLRGGWPPGLLLCPAANMFSPCRCWRLRVYPWSHLSPSVVGSGSRGTMVPTESLKGEAFLLSRVPADHRTEPAKPSLPSCPASVLELLPELRVRECRRQCL